LIVIRIENAPTGLRGDLNKWMLEIDSGIFVGQVSTRVRNNLWERIVKNVKNGRATMVFSTNNEQRLEFRVHGNVWEPIDFDGIKLILRPSSARIKQKQHCYISGSSQAARRLVAKRVSKAKSQKEVKKNQYPTEYVVIDVETTGLNDRENEIIEIGALKVSGGEIVDEFNIFIKPSIPVPANISKLTGITQIILDEKGIELNTGIIDFIGFVGNLPTVAHNVQFDYGFLRAACMKCGIPVFDNRYFDTLALAKKYLSNIQNFKLKTLSEYFGINSIDGHHSIQDCLMTKRVFEKLVELAKYSLKTLVD
jgi:CRISPR-associated protein Cas2